jgi:AcrR family transcriptional regulator
MRSLIPRLMALRFAHGPSLCSWGANPTPRFLDSQLPCIYNTYQLVGILSRLTMNKHEQRSEETRNRILEAAELCFAQSGYDGTSVAQICQAAGVSKGALYHHFSSKQAVFLELLNRWLGAMDFQMASLGAEPFDAPGKLLSMSAIIGTVLKVPKEQLLIYLEFANKAARDPQVWGTTIEPFHRYHKLISNLIEAGISEGSLRPVPSETAARVVIALALGLLMQGYLDPEGADWDQVTNDGFNILLNGLQV